MLTAYLADIHANREAFEAVLRHARAAGAGRTCCSLATMSATGPTPPVRRQGADHGDGGRRRIRGNHDAAVAPGGGGDFTALARSAIDWTGPASTARRRAS